MNQVVNLNIYLKAFTSRREHTAEEKTCRYKRILQFLRCLQLFNHNDQCSVRQSQGPSNMDKRDEGGKQEISVD